MPASEDCDDANDTVSWSADEIPYNGMDDDCDETTPDDDLGEYGFADDDAAVNPEAEEMCDGLDNDCDGEIDEDDPSDASSWYADVDGDG